MTQRINFAQLSPDLFKKLLAYTNALYESSIDVSLIELVSIRISQMNGCEFCLGLHFRQAKIHGESELRIAQIAEWRDSALFTPRERAALTWTEALTDLPGQGVPEDVFDLVRKELSDKELSDLSFVIVSVNAWDRINIGFDTQVGRPKRD